MMSVEPITEEQGQRLALFSGGLVGGLTLCPMTCKAAGRFVAEHHRHSRPPQGALFAVGAKQGGQLVGVAMVGRPIARLLDDGQTAEVTRLCTTGQLNACSLLYGAAARAAKALGYSTIITYTLAREPGVSLRAAGWSPDGAVAAASTWSRPSRSRVQTDLFGEAQRPTEAKQRWRKQLATGAPSQPLTPNSPVRDGASRSL